jgi:ribosomal protein S27E
LCSAERSIGVILHPRQSIGDPSVQRCPSCDHIQFVQAATCERCGAALQSATDEPSGGAAGPPQGSLEAEVVELAATRGKIEAIKRYRQARNSSLKDAKEAIERLMEQYGVQGAGRSGCAILLLGLVIAGACSAAVIAT